MGPITVLGQFVELQYNPQLAEQKGGDPSVKDQANRVLLNLMLENLLEEEVEKLAVEGNNKFKTNLIKIIKNVLFLVFVFSCGRVTGGRRELNKHNTHTSDVYHIDREGSRKFLSR